VTFGPCFFDPVMSMISVRDVLDTLMSVIYVCDVYDGLDICDVPNVRDVLDIMILLVSRPIYTLYINTIATNVSILLAWLSAAGKEVVLYLVARNT
jgi:hypothetical protein